MRAWLSERQLRIAEEVHKQNGPTRFSVFARDVLFLGVLLTAVLVAALIFVG